MEKYYGNYLGLVVNDQDPEGRDRVQIYVPGVTNTIYDNWNNNNTNKSIGMDIGSTFTLNEEILKKLRSVLPWAEKATPLIGPGTAMYHQENRGAASVPIEPSYYIVPVGTNNEAPVFTGDNIDGKPTDGLDSNIKNLLPSFKEEFPKSTITSTVRTYDAATNTVRGSDGRVVTGSSAGSLHNAEKDKNGNYTKLSRAIDIRMPVSPTEQESIIQWWMQNGATEIGWEGDHIHIGFRRDDKKNVFWRNSGGNVNTNLSGSPTWFQNIGNQFKRGQIRTFKDDRFVSPISEISPASATPESPSQDVTTEDGSTSTTTTVPEGTATSVPEVPRSSSPGEGVPSGTRSTTKILSRVWLFFYGGDVQTPVFFAYSLPPNETRAHNNVSVNTSTSTSTSSSSTHSIGEGVSGNTNREEINSLPVSEELEFNDGENPASKFTNIKEDDSGIYIGTLDGTTDKYELTIVNNNITAVKKLKE
jgi:hypothetical protein